MSARVVLALAVTLAAGSAWAADKAQPRGGGSSDREHSGATSRQPSSSGGGSSWSKDSSSTSSRDSSSTSSSDSGRSRPPQTAAQRRHPRPGTGTGHFRGSGRDYRYSWGSPYYGSRYGYRYGWYYNPYDYWYSPYYYSGYYGYSPAYYRRGYYGRGSYRDTGSLRIIVQPEKTRVYVDGYYAGVADDFDGILQRLNVPPGRHDISLRLEGYRTQHFKVYVPVDQTIKIHYDMVRGGGEATSDEYAGRPADDYVRFEEGEGSDEPDWDRDDAAETGTVRLSVRPGDASVYVDGEFRGSGRQSATLRLSPGRHRIEVVRPGYRTVEREVDVRPGRTTELEFELERS